ncbi:MAG: CBS domain-containing protein [Oscillospiraceae bacterium]|nr:CBS domain-containing protein [Oscillospiraceae bacterium]
MKICDIMNRNVVAVSPEETVSLAARLLARHNIGSLPVCTADGRLRGVLTDRDIVLRCIAADMDPKTTEVREVMSIGVLTVSPADEPAKAGRKMAEGQVRRLPVVEKEQLVGIVSLGDLAVHRDTDMEAAQALGEISSNLRKL